MRVLARLKRLEPTVMRQVSSAIVAIALSAQAMAAQRATAPIVSASEPSQRLHSAGFYAVDRAHTADSARRFSRRSTIAGAITGAVIGGLATASYVLNATAYHCVYNVTGGPPCPKRNYVVLHTVTIAAGATAGSLIGIRVAHWVSRRL
jgi:hypothetical protein